MNKSEQNCDRESARTENNYNGRHDVIKFECLKLEKNLLNKCIVGDLWKVSSKSAKPAVEMSQTDRQTDTHTETHTHRKKRYFPTRTIRLHSIND